MKSKSKSKNVTFTLPIELIDKLKEYATNEMIPSVNAGVKEALEEYSVRMDKEVLRREMAKAATDPLFMKDTDAVMKAFQFVDEENVEGKKEW